MTVRTGAVDGATAAARPRAAAARATSRRATTSRRRAGRGARREGARARGGPDRRRPPEPEPAPAPARIGERAGRPARTLRRAGGALDASDAARGARHRVSVRRSCSRSCGAAALAAALIAASVLGSRAHGGGAGRDCADRSRQSATRSSLGMPQDGIVLGDPDAPRDGRRVRRPAVPLLRAVGARRASRRSSRTTSAPGACGSCSAGLAFLGPDSDKALRAALAAGEQDRLWDVGARALRAPGRGEHRLGDGRAAPGARAARGRPRAHVARPGSSGRWREAASAARHRRRPRDAVLPGGPRRAAAAAAARRVLGGGGLHGEARPHLLAG